MQRFFDRVVARYDIWLRWVLRAAGLTLLVALATLVLTVLLYLDPQGPVPDAGHRPAAGARGGVAVACRTRAWRDAAGGGRAMLADPEVETLSSFVGVDAANNTMLHTGRMLINLKPSQRGDQAEVMRPPARARAQRVAGVTLYLQPTQDLTIDAESGPDRSTACRWRARTTPP